MNYTFSVFMPLGIVFRDQCWHTRQKMKVLEFWSTDVHHCGHIVQGSKDTRSTTGYITITSWNSMGVKKLRKTLNCWIKGLKKWLPYILTYETSFLDCKICPGWGSYGRSLKPNRQLGRTAQSWQKRKFVEQSVHA